MYNRLRMTKQRHRRFTTSSRRQTGVAKRNSIANLSSTVALIGAGVAKRNSVANLGVAFALIGVFLVSGCATVGRNFDSTSLGWIETGKTAKSEIMTKLGQPFRVGMDSGDQTWTYGYYRYKLFGTSITKDLIIRFNADGKVRSYTRNTSFPEEKKALEPLLQQ